jgi:hypothetical protein
MHGDANRTCALVARFWGLMQNRALEALYATTSNQALLQNPEELFAASMELVPKLSRKGYSFHSIITKATFAHHLGIVRGEISADLRPRVTDRQSAFMVRSGIMGLLINSSDMDLAHRYERMVASTPVLTSIEEWAFPTYTRDSRPNSDFSLPGSILLRRTADEILREIDTYTDAYLFYLCTTYLPLALSRDRTFGLKTPKLLLALDHRAETCEDSMARNAAVKFMDQLKEIQ